MDSAQDRGEGVLFVVVGQAVPDASQSWRQSRVVVAAWKDESVLVQCGDERQETFGQAKPDLRLLALLALVAVAGAIRPCCLFASEPAGVRDVSPVEFNRDIRPILADNCYQCHGPDKAQRKAELRLDTEQGAHADLG